MGESLRALMRLCRVCVQAYARFTCHGDGTVTVEEDCDSAKCDSCEEKREKLKVPACFTVAHGKDTEAVTVDCVSGKALVKVYEFPAGTKATCPVGKAGKLEDSDSHVSGKCEVDEHGHHAHEDPKGPAVTTPKPPVVTKPKSGTDEEKVCDAMHAVCTCHVAAGGDTTACFAMRV